MEHRLVMEERLGRHLEPYEMVYHRNGDRRDNRDESFEVRTGRHDSGVRASEVGGCPVCNPDYRYMMPG